LKLGVSLSYFIEIIQGKCSQDFSSDNQVDSVSVDTRKINAASNQVFFALKGEFRDGHQFIPAAYEKGLRVFVVEVCPEEIFSDAIFIEVPNVLIALQLLAKQHRRTLKYPIIAITGSVGKTTVKEWLYHLLSSNFKIYRSPKSYNSQLGVALSLLTLKSDADLAIIETGISKPGEMESLYEMIQPDYGVLTTIGQAHSENFKDRKELVSEKTLLFQKVKKSFFGPGLHIDQSIIDQSNAVVLPDLDFENEYKSMPFKDKGSRHSASLAIGIALYFKVTKKQIVALLPQLPQLAMRLETFEGVDESLIINDTYNLDLDALVYSLEYQLTQATNRKRVLVVGLHAPNASMEEKIKMIAAPFNLDLLLIGQPGDIPKFDIHNALVLIKGTRQANMQEFAVKLKLKKHKTELLIDFSALRNNLTAFKKLINPSTKILTMIKSQAYGMGLVKTGLFLEKMGVDYLGVAYVDEGVELRKAGVQLPILVMNAEDAAFSDCIDYNLEPALYSYEQLEAFVHQLIGMNRSGFPIHIKLDTGMHRLGFELKDLRRLTDILQTQPEIVVKGVYSHLSDADNRRDNRFTNLQISQFELAVNQIKLAISHDFISHLLNSEGIAHYPKAQFDMVRIGIGMFGINQDPQFSKKLHPIVSWKSVVSQIKNIQAGASVGYNRSYIATNEIKIAIIPIGYGDGFKRNLSNGKGKVFIQGKACPTIGRVCMDMIMVDITKLQVHVGEEVELIGPHQSLEQMALAMGTIPYEVLTSFSPRVHRSYLNDE